MAYADELLDGFQEMLADFGTTITLEGSDTPIPVLPVFPEDSLAMKMAGFQAEGSFNFEVRRADAAAAGIAEKVKFIPANKSQVYKVAHIEDDGASPLIYVSAEAKE